MRLFVLTMLVVALACIGCAAEEQPSDTSSDAQPTADQDGSAGVSFEGFDTAPKPIKIVSPTYPEAARSAGISGTTHIEVVVDKTGNVQETRVIKSSGDARLDEAAEEAALQCRFEPATREGNAVVAKVVLPIKFELD